MNHDAFVEQAWLLGNLENGDLTPKALFQTLCRFRKTMKRIDYCPLTFIYSETPILRFSRDWVKKNV